MLPSNGTPAVLVAAVPSVTTNVRPCRFTTTIGPRSTWTPAGPVATLVHDVEADGTVKGLSAISAG